MVNEVLNEADSSMNTDETPSTIDIEVVYGLPHKQNLMSITVASELTVEQAITESGMLMLFKEIDLSVNKVGIWNMGIVLETISGHNLFSKGEQVVD